MFDANGDDPRVCEGWAQFIALKKRGSSILKTYFGRERVVANAMVCFGLRRERDKYQRGREGKKRKRAI